MGEDFITYQNAIKFIRENAIKLMTDNIPINDSGGFILAEDFRADRDFPPFDRVTMDGIAINYSAFKNGQKEFPISKTLAAGTPQGELVDRLKCIEIMTGAILPSNTDTIIPYEDIDIKNGIASLREIAISFNQNIHFKGSDVKQNEILVKAGTTISSAEINIAASIGKATIKVKKMPKGVIISTGDELVDVHEIPAQHQIRRSNVYGIKNTLKEWGVNADLEHLSDNINIIKEKLKTLIENYDFIILTGGVSKGKFDFLPKVLTELGVKKHFHKIQQRPGKPFWFGTSQNDKKIFALPGNPVSSFVCLYAYVKLWLQSSLEIKEDFFQVILDQDVSFAPNLIYFLEAKINIKESGTLSAIPVKGNGSGDFANLLNADGFLILPQDQSKFKKGEVYPFIGYRKFKHTI